MRQNFISDNIVKLQVSPEGEAKYLPSVNVGSLNHCSAILRNSSRSGIAFLIDIDSDVLFSFDFMLSNQDVGASGDVVLAVATSSTFDTNPGNTYVPDLSITHHGLFYPNAVVGDRVTLSGRCVVPKLKIPNGARQVVIVGLVSPNASPSSSSSMSIQGRLHTEDIQVFDPLR